MLETHEQILQQVKRAKRVLLTCPARPHADSLASCLALYLLLQKLGVPAEVAIGSSGDDVSHLKFLPGFPNVTYGPASLQQLVIRVSCRNAKHGTFRYDLDDDRLNIYLTPSAGAFTPADVKAELVSPAHDLIITCDTPDLKALGPLYQEHAEFFYRTPIINIDHSPGNEQYGQINLVDIRAVATAEIIFEMIRTIAEEHFDPDIATALLAGMIAKTSSFKSPAVTPRSLLAASELVQHGARRDEIIDYLYRRHDLSTLRLWGRVLARLQHDEARGLVWSVVRREDFEKSGTAEGVLPGVIDELISSSPTAKTVALIYERPTGGIAGWLKTPPHLNALDLVREWGGDGSRSLAAFTIKAGTLEEAEKLVRAKLMQAVPANISP